MKIDEAEEIIITVQNRHHDGSDEVIIHLIKDVELQEYSFLAKHTTDHIPGNLYTRETWRFIKKPND